MQIIVDEREQPIIQKFLEKQNSDPSFPFSHEVLPLGDISIRRNDQEIFLIERKTFSDLLASVKDGRYEEQSYRFCHSTSLERHHVIYILEGLFSQIHSPLEKKILYSAIVRLQAFKGFSVIRTCNVQETCDYICALTDKTKREMEKGATLWSQHASPETQNSTDYCNVVKKVKKENITKENIGEILLCQIPSVSAVSAKAILETHGTIQNLINEIHNDPQCLNNIICTSKGKSRKISKNVIQNVVHYLT